MTPVGPGDAVWITGVAALGVAAFAARKGDLRRASAVMVGLCVAWSLFRMLSVYWGAGWENWDTSRLLPPVAWVRGFQVYSTPSTGAIHTTMYPPGWISAYLPVALASSPFGVQLIGYALAVGYLFIPLFWIARKLAGRGAPGWMLFGAMVFLIGRMPPVADSIRPHADAPALGMALLSAAFLWRAFRDGELRRGWLMASACLCCLSVWTKQVMAPLLPMFLFWALAAGGWLGFWMYFRNALWSGLAMSLFFLLAFSAEGVLFNILIIPSRCPWRGWDKLEVILAAVGELYRYARGPFALLLPAAAFRLWRERGRFSERVRAHAWLLFLLAAGALLPTSILGRVKIGGYPNTFSPALLFLLVALAMVWTEVARKDLAGLLERAGPRFRAVAGALPGLLALVWLLAIQRHWRDRDWPDPWNSPAQQAYTFLQTDPEPGRTLFPTLPLAHLLAEGRLPHYSSAVFDREIMARIPMSDAQRAHMVPEGLERVCWLDPQWGTEYIEPVYFPDFSEPADDPRLPAFRCRVRPGGGD